MNPPRALIAEDEPLLAAGLQAELARLWPELQIAAVVGDGRSAAEQALRLQPEVCFFDIRMPGMTGLEAAQALAEDWAEPGTPGAAPFPLLVFITAFDDHAVQAFQAQAVDYLLKPLDSPRLAACLDRLRLRLSERPQAPAAAASATSAGGPSSDHALSQAVAQLQALLGSSAGGAIGSAPRLTVVQAQTGNLVQFVPVDDIVYFEAADKYVRVITTEREHLIRMSLRELLPQLDPASFWQIHRGTVVRVDAIASARREDSGKVTVTLRGRPEKLTASRLYAHRFKGM